MKDYALLFRMDITNSKHQPTKEQMEIYMEKWTEWIDEIDSADRLSSGGNHFSRQGRLLKPDNIVDDGPYVSESNSVAGYIIIKGENMEDATLIAKKCPILNGKNTSVEIRELAIPGQ